MVYYISNSEHREKVFVDVEFWWNQEYSGRNKRYEWNLDVRSTVIAENLLEELFPKIKSGEFDENKMKDLCKDIEDVRDLRLWLWELSDCNRTLNRLSPSAPESEEAEKKANTHIRKVLKDFADKWGYSLYED